MNPPKVDVDAVVTCIREVVKRSQNEEEVRLRVSNCIEERILKPLGISQVGRYEYTLVSGARADALYGQNRPHYHPKTTKPKDQGIKIPR
jgi:hypothetical protein